MKIDSAVIRKLELILVVGVVLWILTIGFISWATATHRIIEQPLSESLTTYGCPGCPNNFADFASDFCVSRNYNGSVSDGINTISCEEVRLLKEV